MRISLLASLPVVIAALTACPPASSEGEGEGEGDAGEGEGEGEAGEGEGEAGEGEGEGEGDVDFPVGDGFFCDPAERVGFVHVVDNFGVLIVDGRIEDKVPVERGPAVVDDGACTHHIPAPCGGCGGGEVCQYDGSCGAPSAVVPGVEVDVNGASYVVDRDGRIAGDVTAAAVYDIEVNIPGEDAITFSASMPARFTGLTFDDLSETGLSSGGMTAAWTAVGDDARVYFFLKPNHHAAHGFSQCVLDDEDEGVTASAEIMDPLRLVTGWEGGTATRAYVTSVRTSLGCVEVSVQIDDLIFPG